jgi:Raf kinase inhibitor-like YbhB/YbcL family protein
METNKFMMESSAFKYGADIPEDYTCHGKNVSPPLKWSHAPAHAEEFVLICEDPDAPREEPYVHWIAYHIPVTMTELPEGAGDPVNRELQQGKNSEGKLGYTGPCPPANTGKHRYYFRLIALDSSIVLGDSATYEELVYAMLGRIIGEAECMGKHEFHSTAGERKGA